ncbi:MAG: hypothetical protein PHS62_04615 [Patescibacteria group bacterium]|nr:hypothetical protein [Patescibacteria group bacterium]
MLKSIKSSIIFLFLFLVLSVSALSAQAADTGFVPNPTGNVPSGCTSGSNCGNYQLNDFMQIAILVANYILGIVGSLALLAFIVGGLMWLLSGGKAEMVERGKQTIVGAVIGLVIVFTSYMMIQLVFTALGIPNTSSGQWATSGWFKNNSSTTSNTNGSSSGTGTSSF